jgi:branched-chain amino acid transport system permease protein
MVIIGGRQYFLGPVLGAAFFVLLKAKLSEITEEYIIVFGLFFMVVVAAFSRGLAGFGVDLWRRWRRPAAAPGAAE